jgi:CRISPR-associated protein Cas2
MRTRYLVCYDISDPKRLRRVAKACEGFGHRLQFSVFECLLDGLGLEKLAQALGRHLKHDEDQVLFVALGPEKGRSEVRYRTLGIPLVLPDQVTIV